MGTVEETSKRLKIAKQIADSLENIVECVILGGSMGFGQNYSVTEKSDIDMVVVVERNKLRPLIGTWYFNEHVPAKIQELFSKNDINMFWVTRVIDDVEVNAFVYEKEGYEDFLLAKSVLKSYIATEPKGRQSSYGFDGELVTFDRNVIEIDGGFIYEKPPLVNGKFTCEAARQDYYCSNFVMYQKNDYFKNMDSAVWRATIEHLVQEYGQNVDLLRYNVLNTHFVYQKFRWKIPLHVIEQIQNRTKKELEKFKNSKI